MTLNESISFFEKIYPVIPNRTIWVIRKVSSEKKENIWNGFAKLQNSSLRDDRKLKTGMSLQLVTTYPFTIFYGLKISNKSSDKPLD